MDVKTYILVIVNLAANVAPIVNAQFPSLLWSCPSRGCSARSTFALATPTPASAPTVRWNWTEPGVVYGIPDFLSRGCTTSLSSVVCPTSNGWVSLKTKTGKQNWFSRAFQAAPPYLGTVDMYGNVLQNDNTSLTFTVGRTQKVEGTAYLSEFSPRYGAVLTYTQTALVTSTKVHTPQLLTYSWFGDTLASTHLRDVIGGVAGVFLPAAQPVVDYERAFVAAEFVPYNVSQPGAAAASGQKRIYAVDLSGNQTDNSIAWHIDIPNTNGSLQGFDGENRGNAKAIGDWFDPGLMFFFNDTVYYKFLAVRMTQRKRQPTPVPPFTMVAVRDENRWNSNKTNTPRILFQTNSHVGPMAIFDKTDMVANFTANGTRPIWITQPFLPVFMGFDPVNGSSLINISLEALTQAQNLSSLGDVTSDVSVARQPGRPDVDVLVFGTQDEDGQAWLVAVEAPLPPRAPRLMWRVNVSGERRAPGRVSQWRVGGQVAGVALPRGEALGYGLVVSVVEGMGWVNAAEVYVRLLV